MVLPCDSSAQVFLRHEDEENTRCEQNKVELERVASEEPILALIILSELPISDLIDIESSNSQGNKHRKQHYGYNLLRLICQEIYVEFNILFVLIIFSRNRRRSSVLFIIVIDGTIISTIILVRSPLLFVPAASDKYVDHYDHQGSHVCDDLNYKEEVDNILNLIDGVVHRTGMLEMRNAGFQEDEDVSEGAQ